MPRLAVTVLAYALTVVIAVAAALAHPWSDNETRFVKAVSDWTRFAVSSAPWLGDRGFQPR